jgi:plastocyanin
MTKTAWTWLIIILIVLIGGFLLFRTTPTQAPGEPPAAGPGEVIPPTEEPAIEGPTSPPPSEPVKIGEPLETTIYKIEAFSFGYSPSEIKTRVGQRVGFQITNSSGIPHTFTIDELQVDVRLSPGKTETIEFTPNKAGDFSYYCTIAGHKAAGMFGDLIVSE